MTCHYGPIYLGSRYSKVLKFQNPPIKHYILKTVIQLSIPVGTAVSVTGPSQSCLNDDDTQQLSNYQPKALKSPKQDCQPAQKKVISPIGSDVVGMLQTYITQACANFYIKRPRLRLLEGWHRTCTRQLGPQGKSVFRALI